MLSYAQQQLWFLSQWASGGSAYNASLNLRLDGPVDEGALLNAFRAMVERHETLRTVVEDHGGVPVPRLLARLDFDFDEIDLRPHTLAAAPGEAPSEAAPEAVVAAIQGLVSKPFDLAHEAPFRVGLVRVGPESCVISIVMHHIACDGFSRAILFNELAAFYAAFLNGEKSPLPDLPVQYGDYASWQQRWLSGARLKGELDFWRQELAGTDLVLALPVDRPRPSLLSFDGRRAHLSFRRP